MALALLQLERTRESGPLTAQLDGKMLPTSEWYVDRGDISIEERLLSTPISTDAKQNAATIVKTYELSVYGEYSCNSFCKYVVELRHISLGCELQIL